ncbi:uncharacterized membrane protein YgaE (UPF0421/DUF939 family) [Kineosphaera limosa]|uniref:Integral membrane bound transporter domain-containing protein n=1 Tax=Kineosphaera limosa NBRC 100340 TaxID=1184609 RepID=K6XCH9_9MICO|nr:FUSC family protein [Kineosphaera limosa]NYD99121.1 uncharacterized membrane protein YgaE (UPF0421/DUF939 family) [Kineosphaera limosa]GAB96519.1 hypothetical protein KILIM_040_00280 [Kineosphaera limosa NBRC 100340]
MTDSPSPSRTPVERAWRGFAAEFAPRMARRSASSLQDRWRRLADRAFFIVQCGISAGIAWFVAGHLVGNQDPFFAPIAAVITLGMSFGQRIERAVQVVIGVAVGVFVGDLFIHVFGSGYWQVALIVVIAMSLATMLNAGVLMTTQAGVQAIFVTLLVPATGAAFSRWTDAVIGGLVALAAATVTPASPLRKPRRHAARIVTEIADVLSVSAAALRSRNLEDADAALERARASEQALTTLHDLADDGLAVVRQSPFRRGHLPAVQAIADLLVPLDRAIRNIRVLVRRVNVAIREGEDVPKAYLDLIDDLAAIAQGMADELQERHLPRISRAGLADLAERSCYVTVHPSLSSEVIRAQVRSAIVDLLMVTGLTHEQALAYLPVSYSLEPEYDAEQDDGTDLPTQTLHRMEDTDDEDPT